MRVLGDDRVPATPLRNRSVSRRLFAVLRGSSSLELDHVAVSWNNIVLPSTRGVYTRYGIATDGRTEGLKFV